ncbi:hypothetical protein FMO003_01200 [Moritella sp. F3]|nr:tellurite methyltransferase [Moritella sp. F3]GIC78621.1 hypothetical protein FMO001_33480 [Moritella sp. F1]GIC79839.1 hypothetical protein FMO003_01200 [Moritella sp. F3]
MRYISANLVKVKAIDINPNAIDSLQSIIDQEKITNIKTQVLDINSASLGNGDTPNYGLISCTVTLMFISPANVDAVIADMHKSTQPGGYNLIVCAMSTEDNPCPVPFPFTLKTGQLRDAYAGWELIKYNEDVGTMHNGAKLQFATMLARKPA